MSWNDSSVVTVHPNLGDGTFYVPTRNHLGFITRDMVHGDINGDGHIDLVAGGDEDVWLLHNNGDATFPPATHFDTPFAPGDRWEFASCISSSTRALEPDALAVRSFERASALARNKVSCSLGFSPSGKNSLLRSSGAELVNPRSGTMPSARVRSRRTAVTTWTILGSWLARTMPAKACGE